MIIPIENEDTASPFLNDRVIGEMNLKPEAKQILLQAKRCGSITPHEIRSMIPTSSVKDRAKLKETIQQITKLLVSINVKIQIEVTHTHVHVHKHVFEKESPPKPSRAKVELVQLNPEDEEKLEKLFPKDMEVFSDKEMNPEPDELPNETVETDVMLTFDDSERVNFYYRCIKQYPLLTSEQEVELAKSVEDGDIAARNKFMLHNLRLVLRIARQYLNRGLDYDDLVQEGNIGLLTAVEKFDYRKGCKFSTHAFWWIRQNIAIAIMNFGGTVRIPCHAQETRSKIMRKMGKLAEELEREPTVDEISIATGISVNVIKRTLTNLRFTYQSLDEIITSDLHKKEGEEKTYGDQMSDEVVMNPITFMETKEKLQEESESVQILLVTLRALTISDRHKEVFRAYYSLDGVSEELTLEEIGFRYGLSRQRIQQMNGVVWDKLQAVGITIDDADLAAQLKRIDELDKIVGKQTVLKETVEQLERAKENTAFEYRITPDFQFDLKAAEVTPILIVEIIACAYGVNVESVKQRREWKYIWARNIAVHLMRLDLGMKFSEIQAFFGTRMSEQRYHSTVMRLTESSIMQSDVEKIRAVYRKLLKVTEIMPQESPAEQTETKVTDKCWSIIVQTVLGGVGQETGFTSADLTGNRKFQKLTAARRIAVYILYTDFLAKKTEEITAVFGFCNGTILHPLLKKVRKELERDENIRALVEKVRDSYTLAFYGSNLQNLQKRQERLFPKQLLEARSIRDALGQLLVSMQASFATLDENDRNKSVFSARYGLDGSFKIHTFEEVGRLHENITRERVRQITNAVWEKLKSKTDCPFTFGEALERNIADWKGWDEIIRASEPTSPAIPDRKVP